MVMNMENLRGSVLTKFGSHISTDDMASGKYITSNVPEELAKTCMHDIDPDFPKKMAPGGFIVAEKNNYSVKMDNWKSVIAFASNLFHSGYQSIFSISICLSTLYWVLTYASPASLEFQEGLQRQPHILDF